MYVCMYVCIHTHVFIYYRDYIIVTIISVNI